MATINTNSTNRNYTITGLTNDVPYRVRVAAVNAIGTGLFTSYVTGTPSAISIDPYYYDNTLLMHFDDNRTGTFDQYGDYVSLLMHMDGTNNVFVDNSLSPKMITAVGNATQSATQSKWGGKSLTLDGSNSNLSLSSSEFVFSGDFVIEGWIYLSSNPIYSSIIDTRSSPSFSDFVAGVYSISGGHRLDFVTGGGVRLTASSTSVPLGSWSHFAFVRSAGVISVYVDGVRDATQLSYSASISPASATALIGRNLDGNFINGYIDDFRITKGSTRGYTGSTITVPTSQFPPVIGSFIDSSAYNNPLIVSSTSISSSSSKFGGYAGYFNGSSFLRSAGTDVWQLGTDDFTVESWINPSLLTNSRTIAGTYDGSNGGWRLMVGSPVGGTPSYGPEVIFTATNYGTEVDPIIPGVLELTRANQNGIYNSVSESYYSRYSSPVNTVWNGGGWSNICNYTTRSYSDWLSALNNVNRQPNNIVGLEMVMKHVPTNRYWLIKFTDWQGGAQGGAFAYTRKEILGCVTDSSVVEFRNGDSPIITKNTATPITTGEWHHIAAVRSSGSLSLYLDGQQLGSSDSFTSNITRNNSYGLSVGAYTLSNGSSSDYFNGYLDDLRITKGVARYLENFVSPISSFPNNGPAPTVPSEPLGLAVSEDQGIVSLSWNRPLVPKTIDNRAPISYYGVEYSSNAGSSWTEHSVSSNEQALLTRNISGLPDNTPYSFRVRAQNSVGFGNYSSTANISTLNNAPSGVNAIPDDNQAFVSWTAPTPNNSATRDYAVQYSSDAGSSWTTFSHSPSTDTLINVTGLNNSSDYVFRVAAVNLAGTGVYSSNSSSISISPRTDNLYNKTRILLHLDSN